MKRTTIGLWVVLAVVLVWASTAMAAKMPIAPSVPSNPDPVIHCQAEKNVAAGDYLNCRLRAAGGLLKDGDTARYEFLINTCNNQLVAAFDMFERQATVPCVTMGDAEEMIAFLTGYADNVELALSGGSVPVCGNGVIEPGEDCDVGAIGVDPLNPGNAAACGTVTGGWWIYGELKCSPGCKYDISDCNAGCPGVVLEGVCWLLGEVHDTCDTACSKHRGVYSELTRTITGDLGTDENCATMLTWILGEGPAVVPIEIPPQGNLVDYGLGCVLWNGPMGGRFRVTSPVTTPRATIPEHVEINRLCACIHAYGETY